MSSSTLNFNVGVLGHIDSGKTSLVKSLSTTASTASFDKNPQSQERGITIDLGFSSFSVECPEHIKSLNDELKTLQFTLVDCPGHASLIRTIIGGAQIIDLMILVIDATKGIQAQTAECIVIGEITCDHLLVVLNKIDLLNSDKRESLVEKIKKKISKTLEKTKFPNAEIVPVAAKPGGGLTDKNADPIGLRNLVDVLCRHTYLPQRSPKGPFVFILDHCFSVKGQGTVMTGTVIQGSVSVSDTVEIPSVKISRKVKSIQIFKEPVERAIQGDRAGICVTQFNPKLLERGVVCSSGYMETVDAVIALVHKIPYFKGPCATKAKFHVSIMHDTVMAKCSFFGCDTEKTSISNGDLECSFDYNKEYFHLGEFESPGKSECVLALNDSKMILHYALIEFEKPVILNKNSLLIGSKLDTDIHANVCRLAFYGRVLELYNSIQHLEAALPSLKVYKVKTKEGIIERMANKYELVGKSMFKKETNIQLFTGLKVLLSSGEKGIIDGGFGQSGKVKIRIPDGLQSETFAILDNLKKSTKGPTPANANVQPVKFTLNFKRYIYDPKKKIVQT